MQLEDLLAVADQGEFRKQLKTHFSLQPIFSKLPRKSLGRFLILARS